MRPRFRVQISPDDVGKRVTVRFRIDAAAHEPHHSDAVGVLLAWEGGELRIRNRRSEVVRVREDRLVAGRVVTRPSGGSPHA